MIYKKKKKVMLKNKKKNSPLWNATTFSQSLLKLSARRTVISEIEKLVVFKYTTK
jgi:hypothetical protein